MNDTTFQGNGKVAYVPVVVTETPAKQNNADRFEKAYKSLLREFRDCRNELCLMCGKYQQKHLGACDGCRWEKSK